MAKQRPLSPFMLGSLYRFQITSVMSFLHRATGIALSAGAFAFAWWLMAMAAGGEPALRAAECLASPLGKLALFVFTASLVYHLLNGIRHLMWDAGWGFEIPDVYKSGYAVAALTVVFIALIWWAALGANA
jgi:succinate dehydrogenase / fumarate reductase cytochrome b subunit